MTLRRDTLRACEEIDAALFSGDEFIDDIATGKEAARLLREYLFRWERQLCELGHIDDDTETPTLGEVTDRFEDTARALNRLIIDSGGQKE